MSKRLAYLNIIIIAIGIPFLAVMWFLPFSFFVDVEYNEHQDMCAGDTLQTVFSMRNVKFAEHYEGHVQAELVRYDEDYIRETVIRRETDFFYEKSDSPVVYEIEWNKPLPEGEYGVSSLVTIHTIFDKTDFQKAETQRFTVIDCNI